MSRKYKFYNPEGIYFVSFATIGWIDLFTREVYCRILVDSLNHCISEKGMKIFGWVIMSNHLHLIFRSEKMPPEILLGRFKEWTSKVIRKELETNPHESRKEWLLNMMKAEATTSSNVIGFQLWQHHNHPIELFTAPVFEQKMNYLHFNPVKAGWVALPEHWRYSSAIDYFGGKGFVEITKIEEW